MLDPAPPEDEAAFARRMDARFRRPLMSYFLRRVHHHAEAEDLTQQVFLRLMGAIGGPPIENPDGYVFTIAANLLKDRDRRGLHRGKGTAAVPSAVLMDELVSEALEERSPERILLGREALSDVLRSLDELGERTRDIYILFRLENMKQREIADLYGIGQSTVEKHVMKATFYLARKYGSL